MLPDGRSERHRPRRLPPVGAGAVFLELRGQVPGLIRARLVKGLRIAECVPTTIQTAGGA
jgi:hypothetical protein